MGVKMMTEKTPTFALKAAFRPRGLITSAVVVAVSSWPLAMRGCDWATDWPISVPGAPS